MEQCHDWRFDAAIQISLMSDYIEQDSVEIATK